MLNMISHIINLIPYKKNPLIMGQRKKGLKSSHGFRDWSMNDKIDFRLQFGSNSFQILGEIKEYLFFSSANSLLPCKARVNA